MSFVSIEGYREEEEEEEKVVASGFERMTSGYRDCRF